MRRVTLILLVMLLAPSLAGLACELTCTRPHHQAAEAPRQACHQTDGAGVSLASAASSCHGAEHANLTAGRVGLKMPSPLLDVPARSIAPAGLETAAHRIGAALPPRIHSDWSQLSVPLRI